MDAILLESDLSTLRTRIEDLHACSVKMLKAAESGDWDEVASLESERKHLELLPKIAHCGNDVREELQSKLMEILEINKNIMMLATHTRDSIAKKLAVIKQGSIASYQYKKI
ncbi:MAG: flagellar protein FliT [Gammaproteobacteria bacterium]|nr:flagellar protein FliT [Gammaproteobacteria bacterium]